MPRVVHFEVPVDNPERAQKFYSEVFSWKIQKWEGPTDEWMLTTGEDSEPGINGALIRRQAFAGTVNTVDVPSMDDFREKVTAAGGRLVRKKVAVPGIGWAAYCQDTECNLFALFQDDPAAQ